jgi:serine/threonine protein phosphatase PrpC
LERTKNEDRTYADDANGVYLVIDGLGGHAAGDKAADIALDIIVSNLAPPAADIEQQLRRLITLANNTIFAAAVDNPEWSGMACVLTVAIVHDDVVTVGHVGDSRLYLIWNGTARKVTSDHSPVGEQEDQGELTESEAMVHPRRNEIFRDVGCRERASDDADFIDIKSFPFQPSAALLVCTDGLSDALTSAEIAEIAETYSGDPGEVARALVNGANQKDGSDNVSVVFVAGPDFVGVKSQALAAARVRHAITRVRRGHEVWRQRKGRVLWLVIGIVLGLLIWPAVERFIANGGLVR